MKKFSIQVILLLIIIGTGIFFFAINKNAEKVNLPFVSQNATTVNLRINENIFRVEIADTQVKRNKGLGGREKIASDEGMLFIFEKMGNYPFWMKGMRFPLDLLWIKGNKVVDLSADVSPPKEGQKDQDLPIYQSKEIVDKVLEVNEGLSARLNIKIGDTINLEQ